MKLKELNKGMVILTPNQSKMYGQINLLKHTESPVNLVQDVGEGCPSCIEPGMWVLTDTNFTEKQANKVSENGTFICKWNKIHAVWIKEKLYPLGNKILVKRCNTEQKEGSIIIPSGQKATDQTLDCTIENLGIPFKDLRRNIVGYKRGDKIRLSEWKASMIEVNINEEFHLIIDEEDILFKY